VGTNKCIGEIEHPVHGVLVVDKPKGPTSHDIVMLARRALRTSAVGHTGTLDPMATGLLVLTVGEATKLTPYLSADDKEYFASITLGCETDTLDAEGKEVKRLPVPARLTRDDVERAARAFRGPFKQKPPAVSAIKQAGVRMYAKARRGEAVDVPQRDVVVHELTVGEVKEGRIELIVRCSKGFYVRALARDLAYALGTVGHLSALRRTRSGQFDLDYAVGVAELEAAIGDRSVRQAITERLKSLTQACTGMPRLILSSGGRENAVNGRQIPLSEVISGEVSAGFTGPIALLDSGDELVAIARLKEVNLRVERGFRRVRMTDSR
jgi:tRNA pseudouridine55 synthase